MICAVSVSLSDVLRIDTFECLVQQSKFNLIYHSGFVIAFINGGVHGRQMAMKRTWISLLISMAYIWPKVGLLLLSGLLSVYCQIPGGLESVPVNGTDVVNAAEYAVQEFNFQNNDYIVLQKEIVNAKRQMFLTVYLSNNDQHFTEVPITPETTCRDVVDLCKEPGETECYLAEKWRGSERAIADNERMRDILQKWGQQRTEVRFFLRHERPPFRESGVTRPQDQSVKRNGAKNTAEKKMENGVGGPRMDMTLTELQEMASRQQQQIEAQQQQLASKEQRLRFLKQQDQRQQLVSEQEKLLKLREIAENQEAKLKKVRALKGQVEQKRLSNGKLVEEIEQMNSLFQQKQRELVLAVSKVEELSRQLEMLKNGKIDSLHDNQSAVAELDRLYKELQLRNKLNQEQNAKLQQQRECLNKRNSEVVLMDKRVNELRDRLWKKKAALQQKENVPVPSDGTTPQQTGLSQSRVAAVEPYIQSWPRGTSKPEINKPAYTDGNAMLPTQDGPLKVQLQPSGKSGGVSLSKLIPGEDEVTMRDKGKQTRPYSMFESTDASSSVPPAGNLRKNQSTENLLQEAQSHTLPLPYKHEAPPAAAVRPFTPQLPAKDASISYRKPQTGTASSIYSMYTQHQVTPSSKIQPAIKNPPPRAITYGKPMIPGTSTSSLHLLQSQDMNQDQRDGVDFDFERGGNNSVSETERSPRPLSPTKLFPFLNQNDLEVRRRLFNIPRPLKKRSSITEPEGPNGPNYPRVLYKKPPFFQPNTVAAEEVSTAKQSEEVTETVGEPPLVDVKQNEDALVDVSLSEGMSHEKENIPEEDEDFVPPPPSRPAPVPEIMQGALNPLPFTQEDENSLSAPQPYEILTEEYPPYPPPPYPITGDTESLGDDSFSMRPPEITGQLTLPPGKRTNLRKANSERIAHNMRVKFNPLALLLDSSLEGEFDLVQRIIYEVEDPSQPNDEGITALHNAVCAGHTEIVNFLVQFGVNVNAADSDGWTPLHCAASCNNVQVCKFLVESGAAVFATTYSDMQTAADKCEELEEGYSQCSQFLYGVQEKMGIMNRGVVYALWDYDCQNDDEFQFKEGDCMTVVRREDEDETDWWWARLADQEGYIPRNLLGVYPGPKSSKFLSAHHNQALSSDSLSGGGEVLLSQTWECYWCQDNVQGRHFQVKQKVPKVGKIPAAPLWQPRCTPVGLSYRTMIPMMLYRVRLLTCNNMEYGKERVVALVDMDCFYVQVEQRLNPELKNKPCVVAQYKTWKGGGIIAVSYEARAFGVTRNMWADEAKKLCPDLHVFRVQEAHGKADLTKYREASVEVIEVMSRFAVIERASIDEAYMDLTNFVAQRLKESTEDMLHPDRLKSTYVEGFPKNDDEMLIEKVVVLLTLAMPVCFMFAEEKRLCGLKEWLQCLSYNPSCPELQLMVGAIIVEEMRAAVEAETGFRCSAGISHNKVLSKLACGLNKPNRQTILPLASVPSLFSNLPISKMQWLYELCRGIDFEPVKPRQLPKSIGCSKNFPGKTALASQEQNNRVAKLLTVGVRFQGDKRASSFSRCCGLSRYEAQKIAHDSFALIKSLNNAGNHQSTW
ncbi:ASPP2 protein, partial [Polypterus senegalus]